ncbi:MAG: four helix bundle protein [Verrucomicrobia bacterium]|nr:four helix bundle protein [Verrucomicrobiota bacterium]
MATIERFEDIEAWKKARELTRDVYQVSSAGGLARDYGLRDQIRRAAVSGMSNIAEGFERGGNREFIQFLANAKGSTGEVRSQLYVALDARFITQPQFDQIYGEAQETSRLIAGFMRYLESSPFRGEKFKQGQRAAQL